MPIISEDEIIKVYSPKTSVESIEQERQLARSAFVAGVPTAIPYDMVKVGDSYGLVFEMVKADVIARKFTGEAEHFDEYAKKYAILFKTIHTISLTDSGLPSTESIYLDQLSDWYDESEIERLKWFIGQIPARDTMVHGDFHTNNIMVQGDELLIIDMPDEDKKRSVEAAKAYLFPQMDAMLEELNVPGVIDKLYFPERICLQSLLFALFMIK